MQHHPSSTLYKQHCPIVLASASPRRKQLLETIGLVFSCRPATIDETLPPGESPLAYVQRMAREKSDAVAHRFPGSCTISADTIVTLQEKVYGKPVSPKEALTMLESLNNRTHQVITAVRVQWPEKDLLTGCIAQTEVTFGNYPQEVLQGYIKSGDPMDKAGGYGIQSLGGFLVREIKGSYTNVVGLPMARVIELLVSQDIITPTRTTLEPVTT
ncbi:MAG: septum formation protein Maf [Desulfobulbus propionicus]|nr:MAG: septum formation protein Maf [Desulfobulbus propionicus]